jgi:hypothetical protein
MKWTLKRCDSLSIPAPAPTSFNWVTANHISLVTDVLRYPSSSSSVSTPLLIWDPGQPRYAVHASANPEMGKLKGCLPPTFIMSITSWTMYCHVESVYTCGLVPLEVLGLVSGAIYALHRHCWGPRTAGFRSESTSSSFSASQNRCCRPLASETCLMPEGLFRSHEALPVALQLRP